jgi:hypothetical protein
LLVAVLLAVSLNAGAGPISWFFRSPLWPWGWPDTLIVTGNYSDSRLLGEVAQRRTKQPLIIISPEEDGDHVFYLPYKEKEALELGEGQYLEFIETMLRPDKIVFLGSDAMVPRDEYVAPLRANYTCLVIEGDDWDRNAKQLGKILRSGIRGPYRRVRSKLEKAKSHRESYDPRGETILLPAVE